MVKVALTGGSYEAASIMASAQRCLNLYPEMVPIGAGILSQADAQGEPSSTTHYPTPGLTLKATAPNNAAFRCLYRASNGDLYSVNDVNVYYISANLTFNLIGSFANNSGFPVIMTDNGTNVILCDNTAGNGFTFLLSTRSGFTTINDGTVATAGWLGATSVDFQDTFFIANFIGTPTFYISGSEAVTFDAIDFAGKTGKPDPLVAAVSSHGVVWLLGTTESEVWYNGILGLGTTAQGIPVNTFPFTPMDGVRIDEGCSAPYSIAKTSTTLFWLAQNVNGGCYVLQGSGYQTARVSTPAIEAVLSTYSTVSDAIGFCYMQRGHHFYVLNFPTADATWVYDLGTKKWHERAWLDINGNEHRHRGAFHSFAYNTNFTGDWQNGNLYSLDLNNFTDNNAPVKRLRSFPVIMDGNENNRVRFNQFVAEIEVGRDTNAADIPRISLRWSDSRGASWGNPVMQDLGQTGKYLTNISWSRLGTGRARVFELEWACNTKTALNGAYVTFEVSHS